MEDDREDSIMRVVRFKRRLQEIYKKHPTVENKEMLKKLLVKKREYEEVKWILKKYPDVEDQELMEAVIKKVIDEQRPYEEQLYGEKAITEQMKIIKERIQASRKRPENIAVSR